MVFVSVTVLLYSILSIHNEGTFIYLLNIFYLTSKLNGQSVFFIRLIILFVKIMPGHTHGKNTYNFCITL